MKNIINHVLSFRTSLVQQPTVALTGQMNVEHCNVRPLMDISNTSGTMSLLRGEDNSLYNAYLGASKKRYNRVKRQVYFQKAIIFVTKSFLMLFGIMCIYYGTTIGI